MTQLQTIINILNEKIDDEAKLRAEIDAYDDDYTYDKSASMNRTEAYIVALSECFTIQSAAQ